MAAPEIAAARAPRPRLRKRNTQVSSATDALCDGWSGSEASAFVHVGGHRTLVWDPRARREPRRWLTFAPGARQALA